MNDLTVIQTLLSLLKTPEGVVIIACIMLYWLLKFYFKSQKLTSEKFINKRIREIEEKMEDKIHAIEKELNDKINKLEIQVAINNKKNK